MISVLPRAIQFSARKAGCALEPFSRVGRLVFHLTSMLTDLTAWRSKAFHSTSCGSVRAVREKSSNSIDSAPAQSLGGWDELALPPHRLNRHRKSVTDYTSPQSVTVGSCAIMRATLVRPNSHAGDFEPKLRGEDGFVDALALDDGVVVAGDLFVDCTGPAALIRSALDNRFEEWGGYLPCDRLIYTENQPDSDAPMLDRVVAGPAGWRWQASSPYRSSRGAVFSSAHANSEQLAREFADSLDGATMASIRCRAMERSVAS